MFGIELDAAAFSAFFQVIVIDIVLSGDNAIIIGLAVAGLPREKRGRIIMIGILAATVLRILFALVATQLLAIIGLTLAGGLLLLWVAWKMWRELRAPKHDESEIASAEGRAVGKKPSEAIKQIIIADVSMSLDNVLAVAGAAREHPEILIFGLVLSIALMAVAASFIAKLLSRYHWIAYVGLAVIAYVAIEMIYKGGDQVYKHLGPGFFGMG
ncbi:MAG: integral rane protein TerC [Alphaproteobacteria bacterium]|nr:integral rane protein TerC [Alphaproteobacteria bacterium]